jgi:hypothetical protein
MLAWRVRRTVALFALVALGGSAIVAAPGLAEAAPKASAPGTQKARDAASRLSDVESAEKYYGSLDYESANGIAARVLAGTGLSHDQMVRAYRILALTFATLGKEDQAREAFTTLLMLSPDFELDPNLSPKVTTPFLEARGYWRGQSVKPGLEVVATMHSNDSARLVVTTRDPTHVIANVTLGYRWGAEGAFTTRPLAIGDSVTVNVPAASNPGESRLDYYVEGLDGRDSIVFEVGNAGAPKSAVVDAPAGGAALAVVASEKPNGGGGKSIFTSPIFWTAAAVVVVGGVLGGYFALRPKEPGGATLTGGAECGSAPCR